MAEHPFTDQRRRGLAWLTLFIALLTPVSTLAQENWSAKVLAQRGADKKEELVCVSGHRHGVSSETLARLLQRERHGPAVASAVGQYFEAAKLDKATPGVLRMIAGRPDIAAQGLAYAALSPSAPGMIKGLARSKSSADQRIAARMLAANAIMRPKSDRTQMHLAEKNNEKSTRLNIDYRVEIELLLNKSDDAFALEYALLAVAFDKIVAIKDAAAKHTKSREPGVAMAAQLALASVGGEVDVKAVLATINRRPKKAKARPALSYDPRQTPRVYAIMAAGHAKLKEATDPLMKLVGDRDLHTAVTAARALGRIGGAGVAVRMLEQMDDDMLWPVRIAVYDAAGANPDKASVPLLKARFDAETGRFRQDALYALLSIAAGKVKGLTIDDFNDWWAEQGEAFKVDPKATRAWRAQNKVGKVEVKALAGFYESAVISDRPVFSVDASLSMKGAQIESLKQTLNDAVLAFPAKVKFNIVDFGGHVRVLAPGGLIPAKNSKAAMQRFAYEMKLTLGTRTYDAIERAMGLPGMDTVHFLSDGAPYGSHLKSWRRIDSAVRLYRMIAPVAVHVIYFPEPGKKVPEFAKTKMRQFAMNNAGRFHVSGVQAKPQ